MNNIIFFNGIWLGLPQTPLMGDGTPQPLVTSRPINHMTKCIPCHMSHQPLCDLAWCTSTLSLYLSNKKPSTAPQAQLHHITIATIHSCHRIQTNNKAFIIYLIRIKLISQYYKIKHHSCSPLLLTPPLIIYLSIYLSLVVGCFHLL